MAMFGTWTAIAAPVEVFCDDSCIFGQYYMESTVSFSWRGDGKVALWMTGIFAVFSFVPCDHSRVAGAVQEALIAWHAREQVLLCLILAFFIAGAIVG